MSEFVLILPLVVVVLVLLLYMGRLVVRTHHASVMTRYETWRDVAGAPGPRSDERTGNPQLNQAFFANNASRISQRINDGYFPEDPYNEMIERDSQFSPDAGDVTKAIFFRPNDNHRRSRGQREAFDVSHSNTVAMWDRILSVSHRDIKNPEQAVPLTRRHIRIGTDWSYTNDWRASYSEWADVSGGDVHQLRAVRDVFFMEFDADLDSRDGEASHEYGNAAEPQNPGDSLAGLVRSLYLGSPGYRGPIVWNENEENENDEDEYSDQ